MVKIVILGTTQDGGIPHLDCSCSTCKTALEKGERKNVSSIGIIGSEKTLLVDATPDLPIQFNLFKKHVGRDNLNINGILVTHLHIGHYTGLIYFGRESAKSNLFPLYGTAENLGFLKQNKPFSYLFERKEIQGNIIKPREDLQLDQSVTIIPFEVPHRNEDGNTIGLEIINTQNGKKLIYLPDIDYLTEDIIVKIKNADKVVLDGTFYKKNELMRQREIPHPPIIETVKLFGEQQPESKFYFTHLNHSNPVLKEQSKEYQEIKKLHYNVCNEGMIIEI